MTKMAATPVYVKNPLKIFVSSHKVDDLGTWYAALGMWGLQFCSNDGPRLTLTYLSSRSNWLSNAFKWVFLMEMFLALLPMVYIFLSLFVLLECALILMTSTTETYF